MIIAVSTEWNDNSGRFAYYRIEHGQMKERQEALPPDDRPESFAKQLCGLEVDLLIAAQVTRELEEALSAGLVTREQYNLAKRTAGEIAGFYRSHSGLIRGKLFVHLPFTRLSLYLE